MSAYDTLYLYLKLKVMIIKGRWGLSKKAAKNKFSNIMLLKSQWFCNEYIKYIKITTQQSKKNCWGNTESLNLS